MRIALVSFDADPIGVPDSPSGPASCVGELAVALTEAGHGVTIFARRSARDVPDVAAPRPGLWIRYLAAGPAEPLEGPRAVAAMPQLAKHLTRLWRSDAPDVVHSHGWMSGLAAVAAVRDQGLPLVQTFLGLGRVEPDRMGPSATRGRVSAEQVVALRADRVLAASEADAFELARMGVPRRSVSVVPRGVDVDAFDPDGPALRRRSLRPRLVAAGSLRRAGGVDDVIRALTSVPDVELLVAGGGPARDGGPDPDLVRLHDLARRVGLGARVRLLGPVPSSTMPALLRSADTVVDAPWFSAFGSVLLEAMACRRPVVATAVGGVRDIVADQITGLLVPPRRPDVLARALRALLTEATMPEAYGIAGRDRVLACYAWSRIATATAAAYRQVVAVREKAAAGSGPALAGPRGP